MIHPEVKCHVTVENEVYHFHPTEAVEEERRREESKAERNPQTKV
jgi:hypothetical protein